MMIKKVLNKPNNVSHFSDVIPQANATNPGLPDPRIPLSGDWYIPLYEPFVRQAKRVGEKVAVVGHDVSISYAELDRLSNQLAHYLCAHDCSGKVVAIYAERTPTLVWAMLGVLNKSANIRKHIVFEDQIRYFFYAFHCERRVCKNDIKFIVMQLYV